jgi:5-methylcytosine-specific restriction enzyme A
MPYKAATHSQLLNAQRKIFQQHENRPNARDRGYGARWQKERRYYLREHPLCVLCEARGIIKPAKVVDHITPHKGDYELMWNQDNWQALCTACHNAKTAREDGGFGRKYVKA